MMPTGFFLVVLISTEIGHLFWQNEKNITMHENLYFILYHNQEMQESALFSIPFPAYNYSH